MADDIVERLKKLTGVFRSDYKYDIRAKYLDEAATEIASLRTRLAEVEWCDDMSKAPKDGTRVQLYGKWGGVFISSWIGAPHNHWRDCVDMRFLTHWRPLPSPPRQEQEES